MSCSAYLDYDAQRMIYYCTLFDSQFYAQGMAMYHSLMASSHTAFLYVLAFDQECQDRLRKEAHPRMHVIALSDIENQDLLGAKANRSHGEYAWTCSSALCHYIMKTFNQLQITYVDADLFFFADPASIIQQHLGHASALITPHNYDKKTAWCEKPYGTYCVQFLTFYNNAEGRKILDAWYHACLAWCYAREEEGKFGDQKYLDTWPTNFHNVVILSQPSVTAGPWNMQRFALKKRNRLPYVRDRWDKNSQWEQLIYYHFHHVKILPALRLNWKKLSSYYMPGIFYPLLLKPYLKYIGIKISLLKIQFMMGIVIPVNHIFFRVWRKLRIIWAKCLGRTS